MTKYRIRKLKAMARERLLFETTDWGKHALHSFAHALEQADEATSLEDVVRKAKEGAAYDVGEYLRLEAGLEDLCRG